MKQVILNMLLLTLPYMMQAQKNKKTKLDTVKVYHCSYSRSLRGDSATYKINDKVVTKEYFQKIQDVNKAIQKCNPCYMKNYSLDDVLLDAGTLYIHCPSGKEKKPIEIETEHGKSMMQESDHCKHGEWKYYDANGNITKVEHYDFGKEIK
ncbi:hypothetical protein CNR22_18130 [Sphingobacteriaceae bacterium]|nr:hypothetical protein CNR22_18130 [Sphingobacteriaceae bacterium]